MLAIGTRQGSANTPVSPFRNEETDMAWKQGQEMDYEGAVFVYFRAMNLRGFSSSQVNQPSSGSPKYGGVWYLENCNGPLARVFEDTGRVDLEPAADDWYTAL